MLPLRQCPLPIRFDGSIFFKPIQKREKGSEGDKGNKGNKENMIVFSNLRWAKRLNHRQLCHSAP